MKGMLAICAVCVLAAGPVLADSEVSVTQIGKVFRPKRVEIAVGGTIHIENDDRVLHHAYVESPDFSFDSGEQRPGRRVSITFPKRGTYEVGCDIHPKMRLVVVVR